MAHRFKEYQPYKGDIERRVNGSLIAMETGTAFAYSIDKLLRLGNIHHEVVVMHVFTNYLTVIDFFTWVDKELTTVLQLTNVRASGSDEKARIIPKTVMSLEECLEYIKEDELVEVTPQSMRMRKIILDHDQRKKANKV